MQPFITQYSDVEAKADWRNQQVMQGIERVNYSIRHSTELMEQYAQSTEKRLQAVERKKRRKRVQDSICITQDGRIIIVEIYDTGEQIGVPFILNAGGKWEVYRLKFEKIKVYENYFSIFFPYSDVWIIGRECKNNERGLYDCFIKAGIKFDCRLSKSRIMAALFQEFGPKIENCTRTWTLPELAGWNNGKFMSAENFALGKRQNFPDLPILNKHVTSIVPMESIEEYLGLISNIGRWENRVLFMQIPVWGMLSSVFAEANLKINYCVNLVFLYMQNRGEISQLVQIFNQGSAEVIDAGMNEKKIGEKLAASNDEVIVLNACLSGENDYKKRKIQGNTEKVKQKICERGNALFGIEREINCALLILNEQIQLANAINVFVGEDFLKNEKQFQEIRVSQVVERFIACFIQFAERNLQKIKTIINQNRAKLHNKYETVLQSTWEILQKFWLERKIILEEYIQTPPQIEWSVIYRNFMYEDDLIEVFVEAVRNEINHWRVVEKKHNINYDPHCLYYSAEWLMIPNKVFDRILGRHGLLGKKLSVLYEIKQQENLRCDQDGLSKRIQIGMQRKEFYCIKIDLFNKPGAPDIIDMGR